MSKKNNEVKMKYETIEELVRQRRGYKYLDSDGVSPYRDYKYSLTPGVVLETDLDTDTDVECGRGWSLATLPWILRDCNYLSSAIIAEFSIPNDAIIVVPCDGDGKFRTNKIVFTKKHSIDSLFPWFPAIQKKLNAYQPLNPINADVMPPADKIKEILKRVRDQVRTQAWDQAWAQVRDQVGAQVRAQVRDQVGDQVRDQVGAQVRARVRAQVRDQVGAQVRAQVRDQVGAQA